MTDIDRVAAAIRKVPYLPVAEFMREQARDAGDKPPTAKAIYAEWCRQQAVAAIEAMGPKP